MAIPEAAPVRVGVLRDYPLQLWAEQEEYTQDLLREFRLLLMGQEAGRHREAAPGQLVVLANLFHSRFGLLLQSISVERQAAYDKGLTCIDSKIPLVEGAPELLEQVRQVLGAADDFCRRGDLLLLPRPPHLVALSDWVRHELVTQYEGGAATPWPGPFFTAGPAGTGVEPVPAQVRTRAAQGAGRVLSRLVACRLRDKLVKQPPPGSRRDDHAAMTAPALHPSSVAALLASARSHELAADVLRGGMRPQRRCTPTWRSASVCGPRPSGEHVAAV
jgi:hypothetical protein